MNSEPIFSIEWISTIIGSPADLPIQNAPKVFSDVASDSRKVKAGTLFVALKGERVDGHDFIEGAIKAGASGIIVDRHIDLDSSLLAKVACFQVADTLKAYRELAKAWRKRFRIPVVAVAGSVGKTTTKELLAAIVSAKFKNTLKTEGSQNGFVGIPMTLLGLRPSHEVAIIEVGIDEPLAMALHIDTVSPTHAIVTAIGPEHMEKLKTIETVASEELKALSLTARRGGSVALNLDDSHIAPTENSFADSQCVKYSLSSSRPNGIKGSFSKDRLTTTGLIDDSFLTPLPGEHNARNLLGAISIAQLLGMNGDEIKRGLERFSGADGRSKIMKTSRGTEVICDYYNANPSSVSAAIDLLSDRKRPNQTARSIACLADMLELGQQEEAFHRGLADAIISRSIDAVFLFGDRMRWLEDELKKRSFRGQVTHFKKKEDMATTLKPQLTADDLVLIKGSRGMKMEEIWASLQ